MLGQHFSSLQSVEEGHGLVSPLGSLLCASLLCSFIGGLMIQDGMNAALRGQTIQSGIDTKRVLTSRDTMHNTETHTHKTKQQSSSNKNTTLGGGVPLNQPNDVCSNLTPILSPIR